MNKLNAIALANTFAIIDIILHPLFHIWVSVNPASYENAMNLFIAGLHLKVTNFDSSLEHIILGTILEGIIFWLLGFIGVTLYNRLNK